jgi:hypothetical protein
VTPWFKGFRSNPYIPQYGILLKRRYKRRVADENSEPIQITVDGTGMSRMPNSLPQTNVTNALEHGYRLASYLKENLPGVPMVVREALNQAKSFSTLKPSVNPGWAKVGAAVEYRIRLALPGFSFERCNARNGALKSARYHLGTDSGEVGKAFVEEFPGLVAEAAGDDRVLARLCLVMAEFEQFIRVHPFNIIFLHKSLEEILAAQGDVAVEDVAEVAPKGIAALGDLKEALVTDNPIFGNKIIGADGDFIVDGCLFDVKTTINPAQRPANWHIWLYQLAAYVLLDGADEFGIESVGILLPRQGELLKWELPTIFGSSGNLEAMRIETKQVLAEMALDDLKWPQEEISECLGSASLADVGYAWN